jgi:hypothetical protein
MKHVLLLGAGFSKNWGGWLVSEAFGFLIGCPSLDADIKKLLWDHKDKDGFEGALDELQTDHIRNPDGRTEERLQRLQSAIALMFSEMDKAFAGANFEFQSEIAYHVRTFMVRFDAIFTLNQDLLLERHYLDGNVQLSSVGKWKGWQIPGMKKLRGTETSVFEPNSCTWSPTVPNEWALSEKLQPYFKLHGSSNWVDGHGVQLLVMGGNKSTTIQQHEILRRYFEIFVEYLSSEDVRLMVIGYNFGDGHINRVILDSTLKNGLKLFIADPAGESVTDKISANASRNGMPRERFIVGISNSKLNETFGGNAAEHGKMTRFFQ